MSGTDDGDSRGRAVKRAEPRPWYRPRRSRRAQRWAALIVVSAVGVGAYTAYGAYARLSAYPERPGPGSSEPIVIDVPRGASFPRVLEMLVEAEVIRADEAGMFKIFVLQEGMANKISAGEHVLRGDMTPQEIVAELVRRPKVEQLRVTIPEGKHMLQVADILAEAGLSSREALEAAMRDPELLAELGIDRPTVEGFLFPDTYQFDSKTSAPDIIRRLVGQHRRVFDAVRRKHIEGAEKLEEDFGWKDAEVVTLASIIEKETAVGEERPLISAVFQNRMRFDSFKPKYLATDPTIIYGCTVPTEKSAACQKFEDRIRTIHLRDKDNPYNTYTHEGLPPGPISNPGRAALEAAFDPARSRYLFFVSKNDGTHYFSKTREEHERMVDKYQRGGG